VKQRDWVAMTGEKTAAILARPGKLQLATINRGGTAHLVTMFYTVLDGRIGFWAYRSSHKAHNIARDPRVSCLADAARSFRAVQDAGGRPRPYVLDRDEAVGIGRRIAAPMRDVTVEALEDYVTSAAPERVGDIVEPERVVSWDHQNRPSAV
jgi:hypothetical protein